jgi:hypothetical protein
MRTFKIGVLVNFEIRRRRSLISAQRLEAQRQPWGQRVKNTGNPVRVSIEPNPFKTVTPLANPFKGFGNCERFQRFDLILFANPRLSQRSNLGLKLASPFGVSK